MPILYLLFALVAVGALYRLLNYHVAIPQRGRTVVNVVLALIVVGMVLWLINTYIPMAASIKGLLNIVVVVACCVMVLQAFGLWSGVVRTFHRVKDKSAKAMDEHSTDHSEPVHGGYR